MFSFSLCPIEVRVACGLWIFRGKSASAKKHKSAKKKKRATRAKLEQFGPYIDLFHYEPCACSFDHGERIEPLFHVSSSTSFTLATVASCWLRSPSLPPSPANWVLSVKLTGFLPELHEITRCLLSCGVCGTWKSLFWACFVWAACGMKQKTKLWYSTLIKLIRTATPIILSSAMLNELLQVSRVFTFHSQKRVI